MNNNIRIALVEDQQLFRNGIHAMLKDMPDMEVLTSLANGSIFLEWLNTAPVAPDVILADMDMPEINGFDLAGIIRKDYPAIKVIILTVYNQERFIIKMIEAGAAGYLVKNCDIEEVALAIRTAHKTGFYFNDSTLTAMHNGYRYKAGKVRSVSNIPIELTEREAEVLKLICMEFTNAEIADKLFISARTVDGHRNNLLAKTGCRNTAGLVLFAVNYNIYELKIFK